MPTRAEDVDALERLADCAADAAIDPLTAPPVYERLRKAAAELNRRLEFASASEFETMFPDFETQLEIDALNAQIGSRTREESPPQLRLLRNLSAWSSGAALAFREANRGSGGQE
jgi:hypothetical protein